MKEHIASPEQYGFSYEDIEFTSEDGTRLHGWWFTGEQPARGTVLYLHGNAQNISTHAGLIYWLTEYQYDVFIFDYRGYGKSAGEAELAGAIADIGAAKRYALQRVQQKQPLFVIGHSLGASMGIYALAQDHQGVEGAIFVAPFSEYSRVAREMLSTHWLGWLFQWPVSLSISDQFDPLKVVNRLQGMPSVFVYSEGDQVIHPQHVRALYERAADPKTLERVRGGHNQIFSVDETQRMIVATLNRWSLSQR